jgi:hypothetical protein
MENVYILSWQATAAISVIVMVVMWFLSAVLKFPRLVGILVAIGLSFAAKYYWWWVDTKVTAWARFMGLEV